MNFYKMTDVERQILINQYELLSKQTKTAYQKAYYNAQVDFLKKGQIYLFERNLDNNSTYFETIIDYKESEIVMDILSLHDVIITSAQNNKMKGEVLAFDFNNDDYYVSFAKDAIASNLFPAYSKFKVIDSHGGKTIKDHKKQLNYWKSINKNYQLSSTELEKILDYSKLP